MQPLEAALRVACADVPGTIYLAVSGGRDSAALLQAAAASLPLARLCVLHADHGLHPDSASWCGVVRLQASSLGVRFRGTRLAVASSGSLEAAARAARYAWFAGQLSPGDVLLTAHHQRDQAETALLRLVQGRGAYGMPQERPLGGGVLRRPWLGVADVDIAAYAQGLRHVEDPSNASLGIDRNYLRHRLLPALTERWPDAEARLADVAARTRTQDVAARRLLAGVDPLPATWLDGDEAVAVQVLGWWLAGICGRVPASTLRAFVRRSYAPVQVRGGRLVAWDGQIYFAAQLPSSRPLISAHDCELPHGRLRVTAMQARSLEVRFGAAGVAWPHGARSEPVGEVLRRLGVAAWLRDRVPLVFADGVLVALADLHTAAQVHVDWKPTNASGNFLPPG